MILKKTWILLILFFISSIFISSTKQQIFLDMDNSKLNVIGWIPYWDQENAVNSFKKHVGAFNYISVFWYKLNKDGKITTYDGVNEDTSIITYAHDNNVKVLALLANLQEDSGTENWDTNVVDSVISSFWTRKQHINDILRLTEQKNFDGIVIDYEALPSSERIKFSRFIEQLAYELHKRNKILGVAIHPKTSEDNPEEDNGSHAQDLMRISNAADQLYFMTYLENGTFSQPGPLGSPVWIENVMLYALTDGQVDPQKAFVGIGLTGAEWKKEKDGSYSGKRDDITYEDVYNLVEQKGIEPKWDDTSQTPYIEYDDRVLWFENAYSFSERLLLAKNLGVRGIALWRLGKEDDQIWDLLN